MDKNAIKKYAVWARRELIEKVSQKALQYGIEEGKELALELESINGVLLSDVERKQRKALINKINESSFMQVMEEVSYTWFNRIIALRFMEVNGYLPSHVRVFTDENNHFKPQIMTEALHLEFEVLDKEKIMTMQQNSQDDELFKYLLLSQCNELNTVLPKMFQKISDYSELLLPDYLLREGSVIEQLVKCIPEDDWTNQVEIIGWLYQYYNLESFDQIYDGSMSKTKVSKEMLPSATQLFTPDWVVRYMVENSLGRFACESGISPNHSWEFYLNNETSHKSIIISPETIKCIDPCMGSGHILTYMFDVLFQIYEEAGYTPRDAVRLIIENNIYGLDIDERASQLAYFAIMMKARQYDRRFLNHPIQPNVYTINESNYVDNAAIDYFVNNDSVLKKELNIVLEQMKDAKELGSIIKSMEVDWEVLYSRFREIEGDISLFKDICMQQIYPMIRAANIMSNKYQVVCTNPPYLGSQRFNGVIAEYIEKNYADAKSDLATVMLTKIYQDLCEQSGYVGAITTVSWMYLKSFETFRTWLIKKFDFINLVDFGTELFDGKIGHLPIVAWVLKNERVEHEMQAIDLTEYCYSRRDEKRVEFNNKKNWYHVNQKYFMSISGHPIAYAANDEMIAAFENSESLSEFACPRQGLITGDVKRFVRKWFEVSTSKINFNSTYAENDRDGKWFPYSNGGNARRWYGNNEDVVNWETNGLEILNFKDEKGKLRSRPQNQQFYFREGGTWSAIAGGSFAIRYFPEGFLFSNAGMAIYAEQRKLLYAIGFLNTQLAKKYLRLFNEGLNCNQGDVAKLPIIYDANKADSIEKLVRSNIDLAKQDWDMHETSWDFKSFYLLKYGVSTIREAVNLWMQECAYREQQIEKNEEELETIFGDIYNIVDSRYDQRENTLTDCSEELAVKELISYSVGCMMGRYSIEGIQFSKDEDGIIPICEDEYFSDDIVTRFVLFIKETFGKDNLEENLEYISSIIGGTGTARDVIRKYFITTYYSDHCKMYQKLPIYWMLDSGKKNGFKCLISMHEYKKDTFARIRTDYVHELQSRYRTEIEELSKRCAEAVGTERVKTEKKLNLIKEQDAELHAYEEQIHHLADQMITIELDDGVKHNYEIFKDVLAKIK